MKNAIIIHGMPSKKEYYNPEIKSPSNNHWFPWVQKQFLMSNVLAQTPEMPRPYNPEYKSWCEIFEQFKLNEETILIGHSCGGGFLTRYLSENNIKIKKLILVAPWLDLEKELETGMFDFEIDRELVNKTTRGVDLFYSTDDEAYILDSVLKLKSEVKNITIHEFTDKGHFVLENMKTEKFPELMKVAL